MPAVAFNVIIRPVPCVRESLRETHTAHQFLETGFFAKAVQHWHCVEVNEVVGFLVISPIQPLDCLIIVAETGVNARNVEL